MASKKVALEKFLYSKIIDSKHDFFKKSFLFIEHFTYQNFYMNLVSNFSIKVLYKNHFFDSLTPFTLFYSFWPRNKSFSGIDIGTGGGFPGLILSFFFPHFFFCLIDSVQKKTKFHKAVCYTLQNKNAETLNQRAETVGKFLKHKKKYDIAITRAVAELNVLVKLCIPFTKKNGKLILMKKISSINQELKASSTSLKKSGCRIKSLTHIHSLKQGKVLLVVKKTLRT